MAALPRVEPYLPPGEAPATPPAYRLWAAWCQGSVDGAHRVQRVGPIRGSDPLGMDCDQPVRLVCRACPAVTSARCGQYSVAACRPCSRRHQRLVLRSVAGPLLDLLGSVRGARGWLLTVGPPGERPHRRLDARLDGRWLHSGERTACSCHLWLDDGMGAWNARSGRVWNRFMTALKREYPGLEYWDGVEPQDGKRRADGEGRMGLHRHAALALPAGVQVDPFVVQRLALRAGYGCSVDVEEIRSADVAAYVAKRVASYVVKGVDDRGRVPWDVQDPQTGALMARRATYRRYSQSRGWGPSAAAISRAQKDAHRARVARARVAPTDDDLADLDGVCLDLFARPPPVAPDPDALPAALLGVWRSSRGLVARLPRTAPLVISGN